MSRFALSFLSAVPLVLSTSSLAHAQEVVAGPPPEWAPAEAAPDTADPEVHPALRLDLAATGFIVNYSRTGSSADNQTGVGLGGELRLHPYGASGLLAGFQTGAAMFGPDVTVLDLGYSFRAFAPDSLKRVRPALYFDLGPSLGFVTVSNATHHDLGGRVGVALDLQIANVVVGIEGVYHGGVPIDGPSQWEGSISAGARVGLVFDLDRQEAQHAYASAGRARLPSTL